MRPHTETTDENGLLMWWPKGRPKPLADEGHSISFRASTPLAPRGFSLKSLEEELRCKGRGRRFGRRVDAQGDAWSLWCKLWCEKDNPLRAPKGMADIAVWEVNHKCGGRKGQHWLFAQSTHFLLPARAHRAHHVWAGRWTCDISRCPAQKQNKETWWKDKKRPTQTMPQPEGFTARGWWGWPIQSARKKADGCVMAPYSTPLWHGWCGENYTHWQRQH